MTQELTDARNSLREAQAADQEIRRLEAESIAAKRALEGAAQRLRQHREVASRIDTNRRLEADLAKAFPNIRARSRRPGRRSRAPRNNAPLPRARPRRSPSRSSISNGWPARWCGLRARTSWRAA